MGLGSCSSTLARNQLSVLNHANSRSRKRLLRYLAERTESLPAYALLQSGHLPLFLNDSPSPPYSSCPDMDNMA